MKCPTCKEMFTIGKSNPHQTFCSHRCYGISRRGVSRDTVKGVVLDTYRKVLKDKKYVLEHRIIVEENIGRKLLPHEVVHHINEDKHDNRLENLLLTDIWNHKKFHRKQKLE